MGQYHCTRYMIHHHLTIMKVSCRVSIGGSHFVLLDSEEQSDGSSVTSVQSSHSYSLYATTQ